MPRALHELVNKLKKKGYSEDASWAIATSVMNKKKKKGKKESK